MTTLCYLLGSLDELPQDPSWLADSERDTVRALKTTKRRSDWLLGRYVAKRALITHSDRARSDLASWEIRAASDGAPEAWYAGGRAGPSLSLSHSGGRALCVVASAGIAPGCDLEVIEARDDAFVDTFFTERERAFVDAAPGADRSWLVTLIWSAKESALKSLRHGLRRDTRSVDVRLDATDDAELWTPLTVCCADTGARLGGWWRTDGGFVLTITAGGQVDPPQPVALDSG